MFILQNPSWQSFDISKYEDEIDIHAKCILWSFYVGNKCWRAPFGHNLKETLAWSGTNAPMKVKFKFRIASES